MNVGTVAALISALGIAGLIGAFLRAEYERTAQRRERMIDVADEFLRAVHAALIAARAADVAVSGWASTVDPKMKPVAAREAMDAIHGAEAAIMVAEEVIPRVGLIFPARGDRNAVLPAQTVIPPLAKAVGLISFGLSNPPLRRQELREVTKDYGYAYGVFAAYANQAIWRRFVTRPPRRFVASVPGASRRPVTPTDPGQDEEATA